MSTEEDFSAKERRARRSVRVNREQRGMSDTAAHRIYREAMQSVIPLNLIYTSTQQMAGRADVLKEDHNGLAMSASRKSTVNRAFSTGFSPLHRPPADARAQQSSTDGPGWPRRERRGGRRVCIPSSSRRCAARARSPQFLLTQPPPPPMPRFHVIISGKNDRRNLSLKRVK